MCSKCAQQHNITGNLNALSQYVNMTVCQQLQIVYF